MRKLILGNFIEEVNKLPENSIDLAPLDVPYNIGKAKWDKWKTREDYIEWIGKVVIAVQRVLKDTGSLYLFHNDMMQLKDIMIWIEKNSNFVYKQFITWNKRFVGAKNKGFLDGFIEVQHLRNYQKMCEYIVFYSFQDETGLTKVKEDLNNFLSLRNYFKDLQFFLKLTKKQIIEKIGQKSDHCFRHSSCQWDLPTKETYEELIKVFNINKFKFFKEYEDLRKEYEDLRKEYEDLRKEYEDLRKEYEDLRYTFNNQKIHHSVWNYEISNIKEHITPKPVPLLENIIKHSSNEGDTILDFLGGGTTGIACENLNRNYILIDNDEKIFNIGKENIKKYSSTFSIKKNINFDSKILPTKYPVLF